MVRGLPVPLFIESPIRQLLGNRVNRGNGAAFSGDIRAEGEGFEPSRANVHPQLGHLRALVSL
jgi:hypothetical protein